MSTLPPTPGQTVGPFFGYALPYPGDRDLVAPGRPGAVRLHGRVLDGAGEPVPDALLELWQADPEGRVVQEPGSLARTGWDFSGWGRCSTDAAGGWSFTTLRPGTSFFALTVFARGLMHRLQTRIYLPGTDPGADALLASLDDEQRAAMTAGEDELGYVFDVRLQGEGETVFLSYPTH